MDAFFITPLCRWNSKLPEKYLLLSDIRMNFMCLFNIQGYALKNWAEGLSDEAYYPWESPKKIRLKSFNPTFVNE